MVIIMRKNKDPYKPANIMESKSFFVFFSPVAQLMYPLSKFLPFVAGVLSTGAAAILKVVGAAPFRCIFDIHLENIE